MAIELLKTPQGGGSDAGMFNLPPNFDKTKYAAEWVEESQVAYKRQRQSLPGCGATADGWEIWKGHKADSATVVTGSGGKKFFLMCRDAEVQRQVNALYGNVSKKQFNREVTGVTAAGESVQDSGILTAERLQAAGALRGDDAVQESVLEENKV